MSLTIGKVARMAGMSIDTIRFYERNGLIPDPPRKESGYRDYPQEIVLRLKFIKNAKELGFTLHEIRDILLLKKIPGAKCQSVQKLAEGKVLLVKEKIRRLVQIQKALEYLVDACKDPDHTSECPILEVLERYREGEESLLVEDRSLKESSDQIHDPYN
ncbi:MAG: heavy metal-responsive transcriptional regulator [Nitrospirota bacterium]|nr:heavy metal-responsive transcriptional regulator [Nitrospirota bacterium]